MAVAKPEKSWVAGWQHIRQCTPGLYAIKVSGTLPEEVKAAMEDEGRVYIP